MSEIKARLSIVLPGRTMLSSQECEKNPKESYDHYKMVIGENKGMARKETIAFNVRKCIPARQSINITKESFNYMASANSVPLAPSMQHIYTKKKWGKMSRKERLEVHFSMIAETLHGYLDSYEIFDE